MAELFRLVLAKDPDDDPGEPDYGKLVSKIVYNERYATASKRSRHLS